MISSRSPTSAAEALPYPVGRVSSASVNALQIPAMSPYNAPCQPVTCRPGRAGHEGDFTWMIEQPDYADALFVFNDNEEQFRAHQQNPHDPQGCARGEGNAAIRPHQCVEPVRAAGIPTGVNRAGYPQLTDAVRQVIDEAVARVRGLLASGAYTQLFYSADATGQLGSGTFVIGDDVKTYIVEQLRALAD